VARTATAQFTATGKKAIMKDSKKSHKGDDGCESRCTEKFVECMETEEFETLNPGC
jgi:hypothetical protein